MSAFLFGALLAFGGFVAGVVVGPFLLSKLPKA